MKNPEKKIIGFLNLQTFFGLVFVAFGFSVFAVLAFIPRAVRATPDEAAVAAIMLFIAGTALLVLGEHFNKKCHYCDGRINFQKAIVVDWTEPALYSKEEVFDLQKVMHYRCHLAAGVEKFKIPHPGHKELHI